jgi:hypothetical protein
MHAARSGDFGPLIFYVIMVIFCLGLVLDVGKLHSRIETERKTGHQQPTPRSRTHQPQIARGRHRSGELP